MAVPALGRHQARTRLQERIETGLVVLGAAIAEAVDRHIDETRIDRREGLVVQPEAAHPARPEILDHDIGAAHQAMDYLAPLGRGKVERERALALVPSKKAETEVAERVALEAFDLDHVGAHLAEDHRAV